MGRTSAPMQQSVNRLPQLTGCERSLSTLAAQNKKHLKNVGPIRHSEPPHAALPFTRCCYWRVARRLRIYVHDDDDDDDDDNDNA